MGDNEDPKRPTGSSANGHNGGLKDAPPELPRPGAVSVAGAAPQGKPNRVSSRALGKGAAHPPVRSDAVWSAEGGQGDDNHAVAQLHNSGSNLELLEPEAYMGANIAVNGNVEAARPPVASTASVVRASRRTDSKAVIRQEMNELRSQGIPQGPGAVSVSLTSGSAAVATAAPPPNSKAAIRQEMNALRSQGIAQGPGAVSVSTTSGTAAVAAPEPPNSKASIKREIQELRANPEMNRPGAHSVATSAQAESNRKGSVLTRSERPSRRALKESGDQQSQKLDSSVTSSTVSKPGAQPSTAESSAAAEKAILLKTQDAKPTGAVHATAADDKSKTLKLDSITAGSNGNSDAINKKLQDEKLLAPYDSKILDETAKGIPVESSKDGITPNGAVYQQKNDQLPLKGTYADYDDEHHGDALAAPDGLVAAQVIDEEELEAQYQAKMLQSVVAAEIVSEDELKERGRGWKMCCCCVLIIGIILAIAIPLSKKNNADDLTYPPTPAPTEQPEYEYLVDLFSPFSGDALSDNTTAQYQALQWIAYEDPLALPIKETNETTLIERYAAAVFYYSTGGDQWLKKYEFMSNTSICDWHSEDLARGLICEETGQNVQIIDFSNNNLDGTLPTELLAFSRADIVTLQYGSLRGTLPSELADMSALSFLQLTSNILTGTIPPSYSRLPLGVFNMFDNRLTGTVPEDLFVEKRDLQYLLLSLNQFTGPLPVIRRQSKMTYLYLDGNMFEGTIPQSYFEQENMELLALSDNLLTGTIPVQLRALERLIYFYGSKNSFAGTIPPLVATLRDMQDFSVDQNKLTGTIPTELGGFDALTTLSLGNNLLMGSLPSELANIVTMITLNVSSNAITGTVPSSFTLLTSLSTLDVSNTSIVDGLEQAFCSQPTLFTSIKADCLGNSSSSVTCTCCSTCCNDDTCEVDVVETCEARSFEFESAPDRGTTCECQGAKMSCTDTACESCNLDSSVCVASTDYGYTFDAVTGEALVFQNVLQYTKGRNDTVVFRKYSNAFSCEVEVNGEKCINCQLQICVSGLQGFKVDCTNLPNGATLNACSNKDDAGYLEAFYLTELSILNGCPPVFVDLSDQSGES